MPTDSGIAQFEQAASSKVPILHREEVIPQSLHDFEDGCRAYFDNKNITPDHQVRMIISGLRDIRIRDWIVAEHVRVVELNFDDFMSELREGFLDPEWEENTKREFGALSQTTNEVFWAFNTRVQNTNSLLRNTPSHFTEKEVRNRLETSMDKVLSKCTASLKGEQNFKSGPMPSRLSMSSSVPNAPNSKRLQRTLGTPAAGRTPSVNLPSA
jgi:hypothetical protein